jgi:hypothetical protein
MDHWIFSHLLPIIGMITCLAPSLCRHREASHARGEHFLDSCPAAAPCMLDASQFSVQFALPRTRFDLRQRMCACVSPERRVQLRPPTDMVLHATAQHELVASWPWATTAWRSKAPFLPGRPAGLPDWTSNLQGDIKVHTGCDIAWARTRIAVSPAGVRLRATVSRDVLVATAALRQATLRM